MKNIHTNFLAEYILKLSGEYASANRIHDILNISLSYTYTLVKNNKVRSRVKNGRTEYNMEDFIRSLEFSYNNNIVETPLTKEEFDANNFHNWEAKNDIEKYLERLLLDELGQFTCIKDLVELFKVSKTMWYDALDEGKIMYFTISSRKIIITRSLLPFLREALSMQDWTSHDWHPTSARATSVLTHLINMYDYRKKPLKILTKFNKNGKINGIKKVNFFTKIKGGTMKIKFILGAMLVVGAVSYSAEATDAVAQEVINEVRNIEAEYQALMQKEAERKEEFIQEKANLEKEVKELKEKQLGREELYAKLKEDSKIRWHRDEYKKLLKRFDEYYNKLEQKITDKEQQILELTKLLEVLN